MSPHASFVEQYLLWCLCHSFVPNMNWSRKVNCDSYLFCFPKKAENNNNFCTFFHLPSTKQLSILTAHWHTDVFCMNVLHQFLFYLVPCCSVCLLFDRIEQKQVRAEQFSVVNVTEVDCIITMGPGLKHTKREREKNLEQ